MRAVEVYEKLDGDFMKAGIKDIEWAKKMPNLEGYLFPQFNKNGGIGLMCDFTNEIIKVYTSVFLSEMVLSKIIGDDVSNAMLFSHHPTSWSIERRGGNYAVEEKYIKALKDRNISIYVLHHPLDNLGEYSTCRTLAEQLDIEIEKPAFSYYGAMCGVIGRANCSTATELQERFSKAVGHKTSLYAYGNANIEGERIVVCPGGGNAMFVIEEMMRENVRTLITGVTILNDYSRGVHEFEARNGINVFGGTHYSTEKYAPIAMRKYFEDMGLLSEFVQDTPDLYDL